jgi:chromosome partitioning protein
MAAKGQTLAPVVAVLNMKGGVGKTTVTAHVFRLLYFRLQKSTVLIDFDPQFNLTQTIIAQDEYEKLKAANKTILSVMEPPPSLSIFTVTTNPGPPPTLDSVSTRLRYLTGKPAINLSIVAGDFGMVKYSLVEDLKSLAPIRERFLKFITAARKERNLICIDCNPSSSFMTLCAVLASTHILVPVKPDRYSLLGLRLLDQFLGQVPQIENKPKMLVLLNGVPTSGYDPTVENALRADPKFGPITMSSELNVSKLLEARHNYTGFATDKKVPHRARLTNKIAAVVDELGGLLGLT